MKAIKVPTPKELAERRLSQAVRLARAAPRAEKVLKDIIAEMERRGESHMTIGVGKLDSVAANIVFNQLAQAGWVAEFDGGCRGENYIKIRPATVDDR